MKKNNIIYTIFSFSFPVLASAQLLGGVRGALTTFGSFINQLITITFGLALLYFIWGIAQFISNAGDPKKIADGKNRIIWGVIAMFVLVSIYGILFFIGDVLGTNGRSINVMSGILN